MREGQRGKKVSPTPKRLALSPKDRLRQQAYTLRNARDFAGAKPLLAQLFELEPTNMPLALDYGEALMETEDFAGAVSLYAKLIEADPKNLAAVTNLGGALIRQGKLSDARSILEYALELDPKSIHARINLGSVLQASGERKANLDNALEAVQIDPSSSLAFNNLGSAFSDMAMFKEARHAYETAVMLDPDQIDALINLAAVEARLGASKASAEMYERVIKKLPKEAEQRIEATKFYAAFEYLKQGVLEKGWDYYEGGFSPLVPATGARSPRRTFDVPRWDGQPLNGKTLLVWREQGLGDELLFYTCLPELKNMGGKVIVECDKRLVDVLARSFPEFAIRAEIFMPQKEGRSPLTDFDFHLPAGSLMRHFRPTIESFKRSGTYIKPDPLWVSKFQERLAPYRQDGCQIVGICWRSGKLDPVRNLSYTRLDEWSMVLTSPGYTFVNLQYGDCETELEEAEEKYGVKILNFPELDLKNDLDKVFALISCLDAVASVQTAVLTMSGAVGALSLGVKAGGWTRLGTKNYSSPWFSAVKFIGDPKIIIDRLEEFIKLTFLHNLFPSSAEPKCDKPVSMLIGDIAKEEFSRVLQSLMTTDNLLAALKKGKLSQIVCLLIQGLWSHYEVTCPLVENLINKDSIFKKFQNELTRFNLGISLSKTAALNGEWELSNKHFQLAQKLDGRRIQLELPEFAWRNFLDGNIEQARNMCVEALNFFNPERYVRFQLPRVIAACGSPSDGVELAKVLAERDPEVRGLYSSVAESFLQDENWEGAIDLLEKERSINGLNTSQFIKLVFAVSRITTIDEFSKFVLSLYEESESHVKGLFGMTSLMSVDRFGINSCKELCRIETEQGRGNIHTKRFDLFAETLEGRDLDPDYFKLKLGSECTEKRLKIALVDSAVVDIYKSNLEGAFKKMTVASTTSKHKYLFDPIEEIRTGSLMSCYEHIRNMYRSNIEFSNLLLILSRLASQMKVTLGVDLEGIEIKSRRRKNSGWIFKLAQSIVDSSKKLN
jgi:tetratricopeptide (TPR) repeat protein